MIRIFVLVVAVFYSALLSQIVYQEDRFKVEKLTDSLGIVWGMDFVDKDKLIFTQKDGKVGVLDLNSREVTFLKGIPKTLFTKGQGGLMDVALSPNFSKDQILYFTHLSTKEGKAVTTLSKAKYGKSALLNWTELLATNSGTSTGRHFGSRIAFDENNHLFFSIGDRGERPNGQDITTHAGSILRVDLEGNAIKDNPFVGKQGLDEIYSYGHRNPQGLFFDKDTKKLFSNEHGPRGGDEINLIQKGKNYGWPEVSYGKEYWGPIDVGEEKKPGMEQPLKQFTPSIAPSSLLIYKGNKFPFWKNSFFSGALAMTHLNRVEFDKNFNAIKEEELFDKLYFRIRDVVEGKDGFIYFSTDDGNIYRLIN